MIKEFLFRVFPPSLSEKRVRIGLAAGLLLAAALVMHAVAITVFMWDALDRSSVRIALAAL